VNDLDRFKNDLLGSLSGIKHEVKVQEVKPEPKVQEPKVQEVKAQEPKVIEKPVPAPPQQKLTGHELLDRIFFNK